MSESRLRYLHSTTTAVIKLGTQLLSDKDGRLDSSFIERIADQVTALRARGIRVAVVSSGAIGAGIRELNLPKRPTDLAKLQAVAAVGQRRLMDVWASAFARHNLPVAQILLTREDVDHRARFLNLRNTIAAVHELGAIPIINENDTVSTDELVKISFGDNDILAALVAHALRADLLVLLSVVDGILDADGNSVRLIEQVDSARDLVRAEKSPLGRGGFNSKLEAARQVTEYGEVMIVANGRMENILPRLLDGEELGTLFAPAGKKASSRSRWIGSARPAGVIVVDDGASRALVEKNKSLLPAGIVSVEGDFERGDVIAIHNSAGSVIARGLSNYSATDIRQIRGKRTADVRAALAEAAYDEVVHRDNLVVMQWLMKLSDFHSPVVYSALCGLFFSLFIIAQVGDVAPYAGEKRDHIVISLTAAIGALGFGWGAASLHKRLRITRARQLGRCVQCDYDLRATRDKCPECGRIISETGDPE